MKALGGKYQVRYEIDDYYCQYNDAYTNSFLEFIKLLIQYRKGLILFTIRF